MKKLALITTLLLGSSIAFAQFTGESNQGNMGGFDGPSASVSGAMSVKQALTMRDDTHVTLKGKIVKHLYKDKYLFSDGTGDITIEIDDDEWYGVTVGPNDTIEVFGEIDRDRRGVELDVDRFHKVN